MKSTKTKTQKELFVELYPKKACNIAETCRKIGIERATYYKWRKNDEEFAVKCEEAEESLIDFAESQLLKNIKDGKETSLIFFLKCKGKKRGYIDKYELEHSGDVGIKIDVAWGNDDKKIDKN